jgi:hypothetical protein
MVEQDDERRRYPGGIAEGGRVNAPAAMSEKAQERRVDKIYQDQWTLLRQMVAAHERGDASRLGEILREMAELRDEEEGIQSNRRAELVTAAAAARAAIGGSDHIEKLLDAFVVAAKLDRFAFDVIPDLPTQHFASAQMRAVLEQLDAVPPGRAALVPLLDHADPGVRVAAASLVLKLMPDRALPVLRRIRKSEPALGPRMAAMTSLFMYECEERKRLAGVEGNRS